MSLTGGCLQTALDFGKKGLGHLAAVVIAIPVGFATWDHHVATQDRHLRYYSSPAAREFDDPAFVNAQITSLTESLRNRKSLLNYIADVYDDIKP